VENASTSPVNSDENVSTPEEEIEVDRNGDVQMQDSFFNAALPSPPGFTPPASNFSDQSQQFGSNSIIFDMSTPPFIREQQAQQRSRAFEPNSVTSSLSSLFEDMTNLASTASNSSFSVSGQSPKLIDLLLPGSEMNTRPGSDMGMSNQEMMQQMQMDQFNLPDSLLQDPQLEADIEEITRQQPMLSDSEMWGFLRSPQEFFRTRSRSRSRSPSRDDPFHQFYQQPTILAGSPEALMLRFDRQTCGILSIKDGPNENPWRTLIWPLAHDSPALYHAIASMTAFHTSKEKPALRVDGMEHMRRSIRALASGIENMRPDTALATTLALAFSESWDQHISTGIEHLRGAKILVNQALLRHKKRQLVGVDLARLKFLCNMFIYMDVIARLTTVDADESNDFETVSSPYYGPFGTTTVEIDPLMGCASTLFPLIGRAANLCRRVRMAESNSIAVISQAIELKELIENWAPGTAFEQPEDPSSEIQHALQTAEAYRWATLLYLHQAVPEYPSMSSREMAKKVLVYLATVPLSSRLVIVQIYPLLAAGAEMVEAEDREWIEERWRSMVARMWIGNIDRCWEVVREVWKRRDEYVAERERSRGRGNSSSTMADREREKRAKEELAMSDLFSFEDLLNGTPSSLSSGAMEKRRPRLGSMPMSSSTPVNMSSNSMGMSMTASGQSGMAMAGRGRGKSETLGAEDLDPEYTVRGRLHWVGVMKDWGWEGTLYCMFGWPDFH
jgi:hypothetical protein